MANSTTEAYKRALEDLEELKYWLYEERVDDEEQAEIIKEVLDLCETLVDMWSHDDVDNYLEKNTEEEEEEEEY